MHPPQQDHRHVWVTYNETRPAGCFYANQHLRPINPVDQALFDLYDDLGCIIRDAKLCDAYSYTEVIDIEETWAHHIILVFRSGYQYFLHCGKSLTKLQGIPSDVALAYYDGYLEEQPGILDDPARRNNISISDTVLNMGRKRRAH